ncbi:hypothetical protein TrVE_jg4410 [Triparma verrucosa]|uniref:SAM domain-containing protein n=1 Tax=Triparma verrucosa TaxID=1606542 RepID=A0A9W7FDB2_9STRA|nr:hypothetical protein TrVE_jg4410 [Triparma verrucosa]
MSQRGGKQSDVLLKQTLDMEKKLSALKNRMAVENEQRAVLEGQKAAKGSYWRSGNAKLGGSLNYARDVKARQKKVEKDIRQNPRPKKQQQPASGAASSQKHGFMNKDVKNWAMADTLSWLTSLGLTSYGNKFAENEIYGEILLELGLDDLDYMGIKVLGHRKKLLKGIEELKRNGKPTNNPPPVPDLAIAEAKEPAPAKVKHWSEVKPLTENEVSGGGTEQYDEAAEAAAFRAAVNDWRTGNGEQDTSKAAPGDKIITSKARSPIKPKFGFASIDDGDGGAWKNPWGGDGDGDGVEEEKAEGGGGGGKFLAGDYDEAAEAAAFKKAVEEWRNPKSSSGNQASTEEGVVGTDLEGLTKSSNVAANLAAQMEADFEKKKQELAKRRKEAEIAMKERLAQKEKELNEMYANKENGEWSEEDLAGFGEGKFDDEGNEDGHGHGEDGKEEEFKGGEGKEDEEEKEEGGGEEGRLGSGLTRLTLQSPSKDETAVKFLETEVYSPDAKEEEGGGGYVVEEDSDDDE